MILRKRFLNSKQETNEAVTDYIDRLLNLKDEIEALDYEVSAQDTSMTILQGLLPSYDNFVQCFHIENHNIFIYWFKHLYL